MRFRSLIFAATVAAIVLGVPAAAVAQTDPYVSRPPEVESTDEGRPTEVAGVEASREAPAVASQAETLPVTGGDLVGLAAIGLVSIGAGTVLVRRSRRSATT